MPFPLLGLLPSILKTVGRVVGGSVFSDAADTLSKAQLTPEQQETLQAELGRHQEAMKALSLEELRTAVSESIAMISSADKFVSRARPTGLYVAYFVSAALGAALIFGVKVDATAILTLMGPMYGAASVYVYSRTKEKLGGNGVDG